MEEAASAAAGVDIVDPQNDSVGDEYVVESLKGELIEDGMDERFDEYESYVDAAVSSLRATYQAEMETLQNKTRENDTALATSMDKLQSKLLDGVDTFLNRTITITAVTSEELRNLVKSRSNAVVSAVLKARREASDKEEETQQKVLDAVMKRFDDELEGHQGRMSNRFAQLSKSLGGKLRAMRQAKTIEVRDELNLQRILMKDHERRIETAAKERIDRETARLEVYWKDMAAGYEVAKNKIEVQQYRLDSTEQMLVDTKKRLELYEPPTGSAPGQSCPNTTPDNQETWLDDQVCRKKSGMNE